MSMCRTLIFNFIHCSSFKFFSSTSAVKLHLDTQYSGTRWTERGCITSQPSLWRPAIYRFAGLLPLFHLACSCSCRAGTFDIKSDHAPGLNPLLLPHCHSSRILF